MKNLLIGIMVGYVVGLLVMTYIVSFKTCTVTITDMQGVHHVIKGVSDE